MSLATVDSLATVQVTSTVFSYIFKNFIQNCFQIQSQEGKFSLTPRPSYSKHDEYAKLGEHYTV